VFATMRSYEQQQYSHGAASIRRLVGKKLAKPTSYTPGPTLDETSLPLTSACHTAGCLREHSNDAPVRARCCGHGPSTKTRVWGDSPRLAASRCPHQHINNNVIDDNRVMGWQRALDLHFLTLLLVAGRAGERNVAGAAPELHEILAHVRQQMQQEGFRKTKYQVRNSGLLETGPEKNTHTAQRAHFFLAVNVAKKFSSSHFGSSHSGSSHFGSRSELLGQCVVRTASGLCFPGCTYEYSHSFQMQPHQNNFFTTGPPATNHEGTNSCTAQFCCTWLTYCVHGVRQSRGLQICVRIWHDSFDVCTSHSSTLGADRNLWRWKLG